MHLPSKMIAVYNFRCTVWHTKGLFMTFGAKYMQLIKVLYILLLNVVPLRGTVIRKFLQKYNILCMCVTGNSSVSVHLKSWVHLPRESSLPCTYLAYVFSSVNASQMHTPLSESSSAPLMRVTSVVDAVLMKPTVT